MGDKQAAGVFNIPRATLFRLSSNNVEAPNTATLTFGRRQVFPTELEKQLIDH